MNVLVCTSLNKVPALLSLNGMFPFPSLCAHTLVWRLLEVSVEFSQLRIGYFALVCIALEIDGHT